MDEFTYSLPKLANEVVAFLKATGPSTRPTLNQHFKATTNVKKSEALTSVIKSLVAYKHVQRHFNIESNILTLWCPGTQCSLEPMESKVNQNGVDDYLTLHSTSAGRARRATASVVENAIATGSQVVVVSDNKAVEPVKSEQDLAPSIPMSAQVSKSVQAIRDAKLSALDKADPMYWHNVGKIPELTLDQFILMLAESKPSFSKSQVEDYVGPARSAYVGARLSASIRHGRLTTFVTKTGSEHYALVGSLDDYKSKKTTVAPKHTQVYAEVPKFGDPLASITRAGLSLLREDGTTIIFTTKEKEELLAFVKGLNF